MENPTADDLNELLKNNNIDIAQVIESIAVSKNKQTFYHLCVRYNKVSINNVSNYIHTVKCHLGNGIVMDLSHLIDMSSMCAVFDINIQPIVEKWYFKLKSSKTIYKINYLNVLNPHHKYHKFLKMFVRTQPYVLTADQTLDPCLIKFNEKNKHDDYDLIFSDYIVIYTYRDILHDIIYGGLAINLPKSR